MNNNSIHYVIVGFILFLAIQVSQRHAYAAECRVSHYPVNYSPSVTSIKVYIHRNPAASGPDSGLSWALNNTTTYSDWQIELAVIRALHIMNEESGAKVKLQYMGFTSSTSTIDQAILIRSSNPDCAAHPDADVPVGAAAQAFAYPDSFGNRNYGVVRFFTKNGASCLNAPWSLNTHERDYDFVKTLMHELGHNFWNMDHPDYFPSECSYNPGWPSLMHSGGNPPRSRVIKDLDRTWAQKHLGMRGDSNSRVMKSYLSGSSWQSPLQTAIYNVMQRPGSMAQGNTLRNIGFQFKSGTTPNPGGGGQGGVRAYEASHASIKNMGNNGSMLRPLALAARRQSSELMVAYVERPNSNVYGFNSDVGHICYRFSFDSGATFGSQTCQTGWLTYRHGLTATYDPRSRAYLIGYSIGDTAGDVPGGMMLGIVPSPSGSAVTFTDTKTLAYDSRSWHPPALACRYDLNDQYGCRAVWEGYMTDGCAVTAKFGINYTSPSNPLVVYPAGSSPDSSPCFPVFDTPGLIYNPADDNFHMSVLLYTDTIYSYRMNSSSTDWSFNGLVYYQANSYISSPVLTYREGGPTHRVQAWFVKYN